MTIRRGIDVTMSAMPVGKFIVAVRGRGSRVKHVIGFSKVKNASTCIEGLQSKETRLVKRSTGAVTVEKRSTGDWTRITSVDKYTASDVKCSFRKDTSFT
jgi:hypothetical protein